MAASQTLDVRHPAPARHAAHPAALSFALLGGATAWLMQLLLAFAMTSYFCRPDGSAPAWLGPAIIASNLLALAIAGLGLAAGLALLRTTAHENRDQDRGLLDAGEGRTRFLAVWGSLISSTFVVATLANSLSLWLVPLCKA